MKFMARYNKGLLASVVAVAALGAVAEPEPNAVFGVLSDIHLVPTDVRSKCDIIIRVWKPEIFSKKRF